MALEWIQDKKNQLVLLSLLLAAAFLIVGPFFRQEKREEAFKAYSSWEESGGSADLESKLQQALKKAPMVATILEPRIAQMRLIFGSQDQLHRLDFLQELAQVSPLHAEFSNITILIEKGLYQEALERSVSLKSQLKDGTVLWGALLGRIAFLQKEIGNRPGELAAWEEVKALLDAHPESRAAKILLKSFGREGVTLQQYIAERENAILAIGDTP